MPLPFPSLVPTTNLDTAAQDSVQDEVSNTVSTIDHKHEPLLITSTLKSTLQLLTST